MSAEWTPGRGHIKGKSARQAIYRCLHPIVEHAKGGALHRTVPCGATVWGEDRQEHLHCVHGLLTEVWGGFFEQLEDPEAQEDPDGVAA